MASSTEIQLQENVQRRNEVNPERKNRIRTHENGPQSGPGNDVLLKDSRREGYVGQLLPFATSDVDGQLDRAVGRYIPDDPRADGTGTP